MPLLKSVVTRDAQLILKSTVPSFAGTAFVGRWLPADALGKAVFAWINTNTIRPTTGILVLVFIWNFPLCNLPLLGCFD